MNAVDHLEAIILAGDAMADELNAIAADAVQCSGDPSDGVYLRSLAEAFRLACAERTEAAP